MADGAPCGLVVHAKGCTCDGWSRRAVDYAPGYAPPVDPPSELR